MVSDDQPDLFDWTPRPRPVDEPRSLSSDDSDAPASPVGCLTIAAPSGALLIPFPQSRNVGKARHVAALLLKRRSAKDQDSYWSTAVGGLHRQLAKSGFDEEAIERQIIAFRSAVQAEIYRIEAQQRGHGGAA